MSLVASSFMVADISLELNPAQCKSGQGMITDNQPFFRQYHQQAFAEMNIIEQKNMGQMNP